jgi:nucleotide-binding universal stress UspA family protein
MEIRSVLVSVGLGATNAALPYASHLAEACGAEIVGLAAAEPTLMVSGVDGQLAADFYEVERKNIESMLEKAEDRFRSMVATSVPSKWRSYVADPTRMLLEQVRSADVIVIDANASTEGQSVNIGHLILASGRPVIVARQPGGPFKLDRIAVAWKDTREARRAVVDALPLLRRAKQIKVVTRSEGDRGAEATSLADVVGWLKRHGVDADSQLVDEGVQFLDAIGMLTLTDVPDLIVSGGYGHSRFREWLLGGVTNDLLQAKGVNRLFSN